MEYAQKLRLRLALLALTSNLSVSEAAAQGGFSDVSYFCRLFKMRCGITPLKFRRAVLSGDAPRAVVRPERGAAFALDPDARVRVAFGGVRKRDGDGPADGRDL